jgi:hypothetical protein
MKRIKERNHMIISLQKKSLWQNTNFIHDWNPEGTRNIRKLPQHNKGDEPIVIIELKGEKLKATLLNSGTRQWMCS